MKFKCFLLVVTVATVALVAPQAAAQSSSSEWQYAIAPYLWGAGMDGNIAIADQEQDVDVPFSTIIDNLDLAFMGHFDMRNERWLLASDLIFVDLEHGEDVTTGKVTAGMDMTLFEVNGGYRISPAFAVIAGARWVDMGTSLHYAGEISDNKFVASKSWVDPLVGFNLFTPLSERWWFGARADIGGFGVGSDLTWQAYADIGYRASGLVSIILGYHALDIDYEDGQLPHYFGLDLMVSGPQIGVAFTF